MVSPDDTLFYIVPVCGGGTVLESTPSYTDFPTRNTVAKGRTTQFWKIVLRQEGVSTKASFCNVSDGKWLTCTGAAAYSKTITGDQQWWTLEEGRGPGSFQLKCTDYASPIMLCNDCGSWGDLNKVFGYPQWDGHIQEESWYFTPVQKLKTTDWLMHAGAVLESNA